MEPLGKPFLFLIFYHTDIFAEFRPVALQKSLNVGLSVSSHRDSGYRRLGAEDPVML